jgi:hypothetical protein
VREKLRSEESCALSVCLIDFKKSVDRKEKSPNVKEKFQIQKVKNNRSGVLKAEQTQLHYTLTSLLFEA